MTPKLYEARSAHQIESISQFGQLPSPVIQTLSLEFKGVVSDYLFLKTMTFMGKKIIEKEKPSSNDWHLIHQMLEKITDLDPLFWDPYVFAETMLAWQGSMLKEANALLQKAAMHRQHDFRPLYFLSFNHFFFQKDFVAAAKYLGEASRRPGAPPYLIALAARLNLYGDKTKTGIVFLKDTLHHITDPKTRHYLKKRLITLEIIDSLEEELRKYQRDKHMRPQSLDQMVKEGYLPEIPKDPYGGKFVLLKNGRVYTTSKMVEK